MVIDSPVMVQWLRIRFDIMLMLLLCGVSLIVNGVLSAVLCLQKINSAAGFGYLCDWTKYMGRMKYDF